MIRIPSGSITALLSLSLALGMVGCGRAAPSGESSPHTDEDHHEGAQHGEDHEAEGRGGAIHLAHATQQALGITIAPAEVAPLEQTLEVTGQIAQDTDRLAHVNAPEAGTLKELLVTIGQQVEAQTPVAVVLSNPAGASVHVMAPRSGLVLGLHTNVGASVDPLTSLMTIADLSQVWATFDVYEQDVALVQVGQRLEVRSVAYPERMFPGKIVFVSPQVDQHTRTIKVRAQIENPDYALKLGMFVTGTLYIPTAAEALIVPHAAIQRLGDERVIFVQTGPETFEARDVHIGNETGRQVEIRAGLNAGEQVVAAGSFHLKAELLKGTLEEGHAH
ncbi:MAG: efflux RND transporter periplasmic adaptor subunit [Candidatus Omnitrophica bacterium]|nr:efflux RND transporter periplasmic adaptor subunit [Candidatus Omnitrophota bacterium]